MSKLIFQFMGERGRTTRIRWEWLDLTKPLNRSINAFSSQAVKQGWHGCMNTCLTTLDTILSSTKIT